MDLMHGNTYNILFLERRFGILRPACRSLRASQPRFYGCNIYSLDIFTSSFYSCFQTSEGKQNFGTGNRYFKKQRSMISFQEGLS